MVKEDVAENESNKRLKMENCNRLRKVGFCGADDSVSPNFLGLICQSYPFVEFGVLFRPDKEGEARYASKEWVQRIGKVVASSGGKMSLAAHLCGSRVNEVLKGDDTFLLTLPALGFQRVQINATAVNGVDTSKLKESAPSLITLMDQYKSKLEFIIQKNEETQPLWEGIIQHYTNKENDATLPTHITMLVDESKGTGVLASSWPSPPKEYNIGYAGGIGPKNIQSVLQNILLQTTNSDRHFWIDMESSLRSHKDGVDIFDLDKCYQCIETVCDMGLKQHPSFLP